MWVWPVSTHCILVDGTGCHGPGVASQLFHKLQAAQVPEDTGAVPAAAQHDVPAARGRQARHRVRVAVQRAPQVQQHLAAAVTAPAARRHTPHQLPHVHYL